MKKTFLILSIASFLAACGGSKNNTVSGDSTSAANQSAAARQSEASQDTTVGNTGAEKTGGVSSSSKGAQLIASSDCLSCHKEKEKLIGPAYADVAKKYTDKDIDMLADKVIKGGAGHWGDVPMTAHPSLSQDDAKEMVKYVLTLK
jgi:cytochrome c